MLIVEVVEMYNPYQPFNPQFNTPFLPGGNAPQNAFAQRQEVVRVSGENGARAYQLAPNSSALLLDETAPLVWLKTTDGAGYPTVAPYTITPYKQESEYNALEARIKRLEGIVHDKPDTANAEPAE